VDLVVVQVDLVVKAARAAGLAVQGVQVVVAAGLAVQGVQVVVAAATRPVGQVLGAQEVRVVRPGAGRARARRADRPGAFTARGQQAVPAAVGKLHRIRARHRSQPSIPPPAVALPAHQATARGHRQPQAAAVPEQGPTSLVSLAVACRALRTTPPGCAAQGSHRPSTRASAVMAVRAATALVGPAPVGPARAVVTARAVGTAPAAATG